MPALILIERTLIVPRPAEARPGGDSPGEETRTTEANRPG